MTRTLTRALANLPQSILSVKDFGAVGDGVADDTTAIQAAINAAQDKVTGRYKGGATVFLPDGEYLVTGTILIEETAGISAVDGENNISIKGASKDGVRITAEDANFDVFHFKGRGTRALLQVNISDLNFYMKGNATAGSCVRFTRVIDGTIQNISALGHYDGFTLDGCGSIWLHNIDTHQTGRTSGTGRYSLDLTTSELDNGIKYSCSGIYMSNFDFVGRTNNIPYVMRIQASDGVWCSNGHLNGGLIYEPEGTKVVASTFFANVYFDQSKGKNLHFTGSADGYRNHWFTNCYFRDSAEDEDGITLEPTGELKDLRFTNCQINTHDKTGFNIKNANVSELIINSCHFRDCNTGNTATEGDLIIRGNNIVVSSCSFTNGTYGGTAGYGINVVNNHATNVLVDSCSFAGRTASKVFQPGPRLDGNIYGLLNGFKVKNTGSAIIGPNNTTVTVSHGLSLTPLPQDIQITPRTASVFGSLTGVPWVSNVTSTTFDINIASAFPSNNLYFNWTVDTTY